MNWDSKTKYCKETVADRLSKAYWGEVRVQDGVKKILAENEWFREKFRRELKRIGGDIWTRNKQRKDDIESKRLMYFDKRIFKGDKVTVTIFIDDNVQFYLHVELFVKTMIAEF